MKLKTIEDFINEAKNKIEFRKLSPSGNFDIIVKEGRFEIEISKDKSKAVYLVNNGTGYRYKVKESAIFKKYSKEINEYLLSDSFLNEEDEEDINEKHNTDKQSAKILTRGGVINVDVDIIDGDIEIDVKFKNDSISTTSIDLGDGHVSTKFGVKSVKLPSGINESLETTLFGGFVNEGSDVRIYTNGKSLFTLNDFDKTAAISEPNGIVYNKTVNVNVKRAMHERGQLFYISGTGDRKQIKGIQLRKGMKLNGLKID